MVIIPIVLKSISTTSDSSQGTTLIKQAAGWWQEGTETQRSQGKTHLAPEEWCPCCPQSWQIWQTQSWRKNIKELDRHMHELYWIISINYTWIHLKWMNEWMDEWLNQSVNQSNQWIQGIQKGLRSQKMPSWSQSQTTALRGLQSLVLGNAFFPESVWAQGSSNSGGLYFIFSSSHLLIFTSVSHLLIFTSSHLHICSSSHLLIFTPSFTSSHLHICSSSHLLSHLLLFTSAHLHICSSSHLLSHLLIFTSAHLHICSSSHLLSHLLIFTPSLTSAHLHIFSHISLLFLSLAFFLSFSLKAEGGAGGESRNVNPFARNEGRSAKTAVKLRFYVC